MKNYFGYVVSSNGQVYNKYGLLLRQSLNHKGYPQVSLRVGGRPHTKTVHRIVAEIYIENPLNLSDVDHIDGNKLNNDVSNLRWLTHGDNIRHCYALSNRSAKGENNARAVLNEKDVHEICKLLQEGYKPANIRDKGYPYIPVRGIATRKNWVYVSNQYHF